MATSAATLGGWVRKWAQEAADRTSALRQTLRQKWRRPSKSTRRVLLSLPIVVASAWCAYRLIFTDLDMSLQFQSLTVADISDFSPASREDFNLSTELMREV